MTKSFWKKVLFPRKYAMSKADAARDNRDPKTAAFLYGRVVGRWGPTYTLLMQLGNALKDSSEFDAAEQVYLQAAAISSGEPDNYLQRGHLAKMRGDPEKALELYLAALNLDPQFENARREVETLAAPAQLPEASSLYPVPSPTDVAPPYLSSRTDMPSPATIMYVRMKNQYRWRRV